MNWPEPLRWGELAAQPRGRDGQHYREPADRRHHGGEWPAPCGNRGRSLLPAAERTPRNRHGSLPGGLQSRAAGTTAQQVAALAREPLKRHGARQQPIQERFPTLRVGQLRPQLPAWESCLSRGSFDQFRRLRHHLIAEGRGRLGERRFPRSMVEAPGRSDGHQPIEQRQSHRIEGARRGGQRQSTEVSREGRGQKIACNTASVSARVSNAA